MITLKKLEKFLLDKYNYDNFDDYCENGLVVEGKGEINRIGFGVSFNMLFLEKAVESKCDAIIVHHGIFDKKYFTLKGIEKERIKKLLDGNISLFGIHLPMDAHPEIGHNSLLIKSIDCEIGDPYKWGFFGLNKKKRTLNEIIENLHRFLHRDGLEVGVDLKISNEFNIENKSGFTILKNGPEIPKNLFIASGGSSDLYEDVVKEGADTFICGEIKEHIPAISFELKTNFINLGHYYSEKPGVIELMNIIGSEFDVETRFLEVPNPV